MLIVDAQIHLWAAETPERPWPPGQAARAHQPYAVTPEVILPKMDEAGVDRAVIVPPSWEGDRNDLALEAVQKYPGRFAVMGRLPLDQPESRPALVGWKNQPGMLGLRCTFSRGVQKPWLTDGTVDWLWPAAEREGIPLMVHVPGSVPVIDAIAARHPGLRLVIDHLAIDSAQRDAEAFADLPALLALARRPNVAVKASALPCITSESYPFRGLEPYLRQVYDAYGPQRMFWGTDWSRLPCSYSEAIRHFTEELPWLSETDKEWIMGRAICEWLGWPLP